MPRMIQKYLHPVNTRKHVIDNQGGLVAGTAVNIDIAKGVDSASLAQVSECNVGSHVRSLFLNIQVAATGTAALANVYMIIFGNPSGEISMVNANVVGASDMKKQVFHQEMIMTEKNTTAIPRTLFKGVLRIPRKMQRIGQDDRIRVQLFAPGVNFDYCVQAIYKEIR